MVVQDIFFFHFAFLLIHSCIPAITSQYCIESFLISKWYNAPFCESTSLFNQPFIGRYLGYFQYISITKKYHIEFLVYMYIYILPVYLCDIFPEEMLGQRVIVYIILPDIVKFPFTELYHFLFSAAICKSDGSTPPHQENIL